MPTVNRFLERFKAAQQKRANTNTNAKSNKLNTPSPRGPAKPPTKTELPETYLPKYGWRLDEEFDLDAVDPLRLVRMHCRRCGHGLKNVVCLEHDEHPEPINVCRFCYRLLVLSPEMALDETEWNTSRNNNPYTKRAEYVATVFPSRKRPGMFTASIHDTKRNETHFADDSFPTIREAKCLAFLGLFDLWEWPPEKRKT